MIPDLLETENLSLRPFVLADAAAVYTYWQSDPAWERFNASVPSGFSLADAHTFVSGMLGRNRDSAPNWAICHQDKVVGVVSLILEQQGRIAILGYGVHGDLRGRGLAIEAALAIIREAFCCCPQLRKIRAHTDLENTASMRVLEKLGFAREGILRQNQFVKGRFVDEAVYGILREEWRRE